MVEQKDKTVPVDFGLVKAEIITRANKEGSMGDIESWRRAFPDIEFEEVDDVFSGEEIGWESRTVEERAFYVAYMKDPQATKVDYVVEVEDISLRARIDNSEKIWWMWMAGCFAGGELDEKAIRTFLWYADDSELARKYVEDLDLADIKLLDLSVTVAPL